MKFPYCEKNLNITSVKHNTLNNLDLQMVEKVLNTQTQILTGTNETTL